MKHIRQKKDQCWLAALCMVYPELDYDELSKTYPFPWDESLHGPIRSHRNETSAFLMWAAVYAPKLLPHVITWHRGVLTRKWSAKRPALSGKGVLHVKHWIGPSHAVAYSNGWVHDPGCDRPFRASRLDTVFKGNAGWVIERVVQKYH